MSTTRIKNYEIAPYYDDYDETKNYQRILFRPGYSVQARELTQLQTALQAQIDRHGQYSFKDGSRVVNGKVTLNTDYDYIKIESTFTYNSSSFNTDNYLDEFVGTTITGTNNSGNQVTALVLAIVDSVGSDPNTLFVKYKSKGGTNRDVEKFVPGEVFVSDADVVRYAQTGGGIGSAITLPIGIGSSASIEEGVYFISGSFVYVATQTLILDKYSNDPSYLIGLQVTESIVDSGTDSTLVDNAQGVPNTAAPGANRYKIATSLVKESIDYDLRTVDNYFVLLKVTDGKIEIDTTDENNETELAQRLARRTYEESGDYSVRPYTLDIKEHLNDGTNNGYLDLSSGGDANKIAIGVEPSVAYVQGFRNENLNTRYVEITKPRGIDATAYANTTTTQMRLGNYVKLSKTGLKGSPDLTTYLTLELRNSSSTQIGTARARGLENYSDHVRLYLFDITMNAGQSFNSVAKIYQAGSPQAFVGNLSVVGTRFDAGNNGTVFKLPFNAIKTLYQQGSSSLVDTVYKVRQVFSTTVASGSFSISVGAGQGTFSDVNDIIISAGVDDAVTSGVDAAITSGGNGSTSCVFSATTSPLNIADGTTVKIVTTIQKNLIQKSKTRLDSVTKTTTVTNGNALSYDLDKSDIIRIVSIVDANGVNVTDRFTLDNGQRDNFYDEGKIIKTGGTSPVALGSMVITFDYYAHGSGDYFTVDSYPTADYAIIPSFSSIQGIVQLRDCIDFRPTKASAGSITTGSEFSTGVGTSLCPPPKPAHSLLADITYYMKRVDKLYLTREGEFKVSIGVPALNPTAPEDPSDAMVIYILKMNPYVFSTTDVIPVIIDNKRYTMRDIGKIDKRVRNLEYYTSLSLLEQSAADTQLFDGSGFSRFKNGFLVDSFRGHNVGNVSDPDYSVAIDKENGILRPKFDERSVNLVRKSSDLGTAVRNASIVTMPFSSVTYIRQPYSSQAINVNPYNVFSWDGTVKLSPDSDDWKEVDVRPDVIIDDEGIYDQFLQMAEETGIIGTVWNEWQTNWTGTSSSSVVQGRNRIFAEDERGRNLVFNGQVGITTTTATTTTSGQSRSGIMTNVVPDTVQKELGDKVVEVNFVPFMRSRKVYFKAELMKPNTRVYPFFNGSNISQYAREESFVEFASSTNMITYENTTTHPDGSSDLTTNASGIVEGSFIIPRNSSLKFKTGTRDFRLTDSPTNNKTTESTFSEAQFFAQGLLEARQNTIISTKVPRLVQSEVSDTRVIRETSSRTTTTWVDPLAETFLVTETGGVFTTAVDLFFGSKDANIPVRVSIRSVENGIPTQQIVPGADVVVYPSSITTSANASIATSCVFEHPVYLQQDQEYAIVIMSQSDNYTVYVAEMGGFDLTNANYRISKQPYNGVFFTSQNASTWTPEQSKDLKFTLKRALFAVGSSSEITLVNDVIPAKHLNANPFDTTNGSTSIRVSHHNHGMHATGSQVVISGSDSINGVPSGNINATHTISAIEHNAYTINVATPATATGSGGGTAVYATENRHYDLVNTSIQSLIVPGTDIRYYASIYSQQSIDGSEAAYQSQAEFELLPNNNFQFDTPKLIASTPNESGGNKTLTIRCVLTSNNTYLSPVIDMNRASVITVQNIINDSQNNQGSYLNYVPETTSTGGSELVKYITKRIDLAEEADIITVIMDVNRPSGSAVDLYYKTLGAGSDDDFSSIDWIAATSDELIAINDDGRTYEEVEYNIDPAGSFGSMAFKIVMRSANSSTVPTVKDFRAIAAT